MDCLMHQVLVAMLAATPVPDSAVTAKGAEIRPQAVVSAPSKNARPAVRLGKKTRSGTQVAQVTVPRAAVN